MKGNQQLLGPQHVLPGAVQKSSTATVWVPPDPAIRQTAEWAIRAEWSRPRRGVAQIAAEGSPVLDLSASNLLGGVVQAGIKL